MTSSATPKYRVGVIGCGRAGTMRARAFDVHPLCVVTAIADTDAENLALGCERFGVPGYSSWEEMYAKEQIDIALPVLPVAPNAEALVARACGLGRRSDRNTSSANSKASWPSRSSGFGDVASRQASLSASLAWFSVDGTTSLYTQSCAVLRGTSRSRAKSRTVSPCTLSQGFKSTMTAVYYGSEFGAPKAELFKKIWTDPHFSSYSPARRTGFHG